ncbi:MAG: hypothetical protein U0795_06270 [Pirellulales bacterium]
MITLSTSLTTAEPENAEQEAPLKGWRRAVYGAGFCLSYTVTVPSLLVAGLLPGGVIKQGMADGARDAGAASEAVREKTSAAVTATCRRANDAYAGVAAGVAERVEAIQDAVAERSYRRRVATVS